MRGRLAGLVAGVVAAVSLLPAGAMAATEFGSSCAATSGVTEYEFVSLAHGAGNPLPVAAPVSGVITRWTVNSALEVPPAAGGIYAQRLLLFRPTGTPNEFTLVAQSDAGAITAPTNTFPARIPVQAGDHLGVGGTFAVLYCETGDVTASMGALEVELGLAVGASGTFPPLAEYEVPILAAIEPDVDGDGYGDETQDGCPQSALYHEACPVIVLDAFAKAGSKAVTAMLTTSLGAQVKVTGVVPLGKGKKAKLSAAPKTVTPGKVARVNLSFPAKLRKQLKELPRGKKLTLKLTASAPNLAGANSKDTLKLKLKGQG